MTMIWRKQSENIVYKRVEMIFFADNDEDDIFRTLERILNLIKQPCFKGIPITGMLSRSWIIILELFSGKQKQIQERNILKFIIINQIFFLDSF